MEAVSRALPAWRDVIVAGGKALSLARKSRQESTVVIRGTGLSLLRRPYRKALAHILILLGIRGTMDHSDVVEVLPTLDRWEEVRENIGPNVLVLIRFIGLFENFRSVPTVTDDLHLWNVIFLHHA